MGINICRLYRLPAHLASLPLLNKNTPPIVSVQIEREDKVLNKLGNLTEHYQPGLNFIYTIDFTYRTRECYRRSLIEKLIRHFNLTFNSDS